MHAGSYGLQVGGPWLPLVRARKQGGSALVVVSWHTFFAHAADDDDDDDEGATLGRKR